ncbi:helix-turn-helix transcriptional regulator [Kribbella sp. NBC_01505]|uniref:winged helix-turn-helix transcriptional regulator n=1 Tax=Kribbella sp. NBC_01505 TaxID=2903580 RepID=UPI003868F93C
MDKVKHVSSRSYGQFCGVARALDVVGDRWNLLIVRDLLCGPMRYNELKTSLAGIATNLLADRLRSLETNGIVERQLGDAGVLYALTSWGAGLREPMEALGTWGAPLLERGREGDAFQPRWLANALPALLRGRTATPPLEIGFEIEGALIVVHLDKSGPRADLNPTHRPTTILTADPDTVVGLATGTLTADQALATNPLQGDPNTLRKAFPHKHPPPQ